MKSARLITGPFVRVWLGTFAAFASFGFILVVLPLYAADELGRGSFGVGIAVGAASITAVLAGPPVGRLADRRGRRLLIVVGAATMVACYVALALEPSLQGVVAIRLVAGAGEAAYAIAVLTVAADLAPSARRGEAISLVTTASYLGLTLGPVAADFILGGDRFTLAWLVAAALVVLGGAAVIPLGETRPAAAHEAPGGWLPPRTALLPGLLVLLALLGFGGFVAFAALYARELGIDRPGLVFALFGAVVVLVRIFGRKLPDRLGSRRTLVLCFVNLAVGLATIGAWQSEAGPARRHSDLRGRAGALVPGGCAAGDGDLERGRTERGRRRCNGVRRRRARRRGVHARRCRSRHGLRRRVPHLLGRRSQRPARGSADAENWKDRGRGRGTVTEPCAGIALRRR